MYKLNNIDAIWFVTALNGLPKINEVLKVQLQRIRKNATYAAHIYIHNS